MEYYVLLSSQLSITADAVIYIFVQKPVREKFFNMFKRVKLTRVNAVRVSTTPPIPPSTYSRNKQNDATHPRNHNEILLQNLTPAFVIRNQQALGSALDSKESRNMLEF